MPIRASPSIAALKEMPCASAHAWICSAPAWVRLTCFLTFASESRRRLDLLITSPTVIYRVSKISGEMIEIDNPSELFLAERSVDVAGASIFPSLEGTRPILVEVQALVSNANFGTPQRNVNGFDLRRLAMLLAVLEKRLKLPMGMKDTFVNLVGGLRIDDPAADLAVIGAIASSALDKPIPKNMILIGEVGLAGEVRSVSQLEKRLIEAQTLGFKSAIVPKYGFNKINQALDKIKFHQVNSVRQAFDIIFPR